MNQRADLESHDKHNPGNRTVVIIPRADMVNCKDTGFHLEMLRHMKSNLVALVVLERPQGPKFALSKIPRAIARALRRVAHISQISRAAALLETLRGNVQNKNSLTIEEIYTWKGKPTLKFWSLNDPHFAAWLRENRVRTVLCKDLSEHPKANLLTSVQQCLRVSFKTEKSPEDNVSSETCEYLLECLGPVPEQPTELARMIFLVAEQDSESSLGSKTSSFPAAEPAGLQEKNVVVMKKEDAAGELTAAFLLGQASSVKSGAELNSFEEAGAK